MFSVKSHSQTVTYLLSLCAFDNLWLPVAFTNILVYVSIHFVVIPTIKFVLSYLILSQYRASNVYCEFSDL